MYVYPAIQACLRETTRECELVCPLEERKRALWKEQIQTFRPALIQDVQRLTLCNSSTLALARSLVQEHASITQRQYRRMEAAELVLKALETDNAVKAMKAESLWSACGLFGDYLRSARRPLKWLP